MVLEKEFIIPGDWTNGQKSHVSKLLEQIKEVFRERFPEIVDDLHLSAEWPESGIGIKFVAKWNAQTEKYLGEINSLHFLETFNQDNNQTRGLLTSLVNSHAVMLYEQAIHNLLAKSVKNFLKRVEDEKLFQDGSFISENIRIVPTYEVPKDVVFMHPETFESLKESDGNDDPEA